MGALITQFDSYLLAVMAKFPVLFSVFLGANSVAGDKVGNKILGYIVGIGGALVAGFLIVSLVKDAFQYAKGNGSVSVAKIIGKVVFIGVMIAIIILVANWRNSSLVTLGNTLANKGVGLVNEVANEF